MDADGCSTGLVDFDDLQELIVMAVPAKMQRAVTIYMMFILVC